MVHSTLVLTALLPCFLVCSSSQLYDIQDTIQKLFDKVLNLQVTRDSVAIPPFQWAKFKGVYESDVKLNFYGSPSKSALRYTFGVWDNNMFATAWVTSCLLEAFKFGTAPKPSENQIMMSLDYIYNNYHDKNVNFSNSIMAFWPQLYEYESKWYVSTPVNLLAMFNATYLVDWDSVYQELNKTGMSDVAVIIKGLLAKREMYAHVFHIPPDFDDTSVNLGLGSVLRDMLIEFPQSTVRWESHNTNLSSVFNALKHYAYRPTSNDSRINTIDTRTYYYMRSFLEKSAKDKKSVALVPTWIQDFVDMETQYNRGVRTPGNINNVDVTVSANALFGITNSILSGLVTTEVLDDPDIQQIYLNTSTMIAFQIQTNFSNRPDLALTYYPSVMEFYWFVARTYARLQQRHRSQGLPHQAMTEVMETLSKALQTYMTERVLKDAVFVDTNMAYYDDFLGDGDVDENGVPVKFGEDRLFTTAMAVNALITTWTYLEESTGRLYWLSITPENVTTTVKAAATFLNTFVLSGEYMPWNTFFSGSVKEDSTSSNYYPANRVGRVNGTSSNSTHSKIYIHGMEGVANATWYEEEFQKLKQKYHTPEVFPGYNTGKRYFPFWCSEAYTYVTSMLALSMFNNIDEIK